MKIAIVGSSHLTEEEEIKVRKYCEYILTRTLKENRNQVLVSGGANGVDKIAEDVADYFSIKTEIYKPKKQETEYFRERNEKIAEVCDVLYSIATPVKKTECYHCDKMTPKHERTGGCWTGKMARDKGKGVFTIIL